MTELAQLHERVRKVEDGQSELMHAIVAIKESVQRTEGYMAQQIQIQTRQEEDRESLGRAFTTIEKLERRLRAIENQLPVLTLTSNGVRQWGMAAAIALTGALIGGGVTMFFGG